jgi:hypothetical protein
MKNAAGVDARDFFKSFVGAHVAGIGAEGRRDTPQCGGVGHATVRWSVFVMVGCAMPRTLLISACHRVCEQSG